MRHALQIPEIQSIIAQFLCHISPSHLLPLALTSRSWHDAAIPVLWQQLHGIQPLLRLMPRDLWQLKLDEDELEDHMDKYEELHLKRDVVPSDWHRVLVYSRLVRRLHLPLKYPNKPIIATVSEDALGALAASFPSEYSPLFPNLRQLHWVTTDAVALPFFPLLLSPHLQIIRLGLGHSSHEQGYAMRAQVLALIKPIAPSLELFQYNWTRTQEISVMSDLILHCSSRITSLSISTLDNNALEHISTLPNLVSLCMTHVKDVQFGYAFPNPTRLKHTNECFPMLHKIDIIVQSVEFVLGLFELMHDPTQLESVLVQVVRDYIRPAQWSRLISFITDPPSSPRKRPRLKKLEIHESSTSLSKPHLLSLTVPSSTLLPLCACPHLQIVDLKTSLDIMTDDVLVTRLARALPGLKELVISCPPGYAVRKYDREQNSDSNEPGLVTLPGLIPLAMQCKGLRRLGLVLDTEKGFDPSSVDRPGYANGKPVWPEADDEKEFPRASMTRHSTSLTLRVYDSLVHDPMAVATYLTGLFDNIHAIEADADHVRADDGEDEAALGARRMWGTVMYLVPILSAIRFQERNDVVGVVE